MDKHRLTQRWIRIEDYLGALARRRTARRMRQPRTRTEPEAPRLMLSTLPFAALIAMLAVLLVGIAVVAWPGRHIPEPPPPERKLGTAPPGWFAEAKKEFR